MVRGPEVFISQQNLHDMGLENHDSTLPVLNRADGCWIYLSEGGQSDGQHSNIHRVRMNGSSVDLSSARPVEVSGIPDANVNELNGWKGWVMNFYRISENEVLAFVHYEDQERGFKEDFRMGLAYSDDEGASFRHLGFILSVELPSKMIKSGGVTTGKINIAGGGLRWDDRYFYYYFNDYSRPDRSDRHGAVARASVQEVISSARSGGVSAWHKYYNGEWTEPGLGGRASSIGQVENPSADVWSAWVVPGNHSYVMFNTFLGKWITFAMKSSVITMTATADPLNFSGEPVVVHHLPEKTAAAYFTIVPSGNGEGFTCGQEFELWYRTWKDGEKPVIYNTERLLIHLGDKDIGGFEK
jgi:hypothetical protein